jgi:hypothetical protein
MKMKAKLKAEMKEDEVDDEDVHLRAHVPYLFAVTEQCDISNTLRSNGRAVLYRIVA